ncbi:DUF2493 domain-containing protein (plasmid) [Aliarcobacter lanthieri]|uniref:DUF2493 domain-containing protein n=1 Tax=Aliarcobacter lanthieri TaxID=1355374 RepID=UPI003AAB9475
MKLAVVGSRSFNNYEILERIINKIAASVNISTIVSGGAFGADLLGKRYAKENNLEYIEILPNWNKYGKRAGYVRNVEIWDNSDLGVAFWDGESKGTAHSFEIAKKQNKTIYIYNSKEKSLTFENR